MPRASRAHQATPTRSGRTPATVSSLICRTRSPPGSAVVTAWHSAGSSRSSASRQIAYTPTCGPSRRICTAPGSMRSFRDPSKTTTMSCRNETWSIPESRWARCRPAMMACSSAIRAATVSASFPIRATERPSPGRQCGSHLTHSQADRPEESVSTQICRSFGLCRVAAWAISQRPTLRGASPGPATPSTPRSRSGTATGASGTSQITVRRCSSWAGSASSTAEGRSAVPTRSSR